MSEVLKHEGRLSRKRLEEKEIRLKLDGLREAMRDLLDPFEPHERIRGDVLAQQAVEYENARIRLLEVIEEIAAIERALGRS
jgi:hypothetical protein